MQMQMNDCACLRWAAASLIAAACLTGIAFGQNDGRSQNHIFPEFADGRFPDGTSYRSAIHILNPSSAFSASCTVSVRGISVTLENSQGGTVTAGTFQSTIPANSFAIYRSPGSAAFQSGYATLSCTAPVNAFVIYGYYSPGGVKLSEAAVF